MIFYPDLFSFSIDHSNYSYYMHSLSYQKLFHMDNLLAQIFYSSLKLNASLLIIKNTPIFFLVIFLWWILDITSQA
jgi:hypothetical protein